MALRYPAHAPSKTLTPIATIAFLNVRDNKISGSNNPGILKNPQIRA